MRFALGIEYDGRGFCGWQSQASDPSVQSTVEKALSAVADHQVRVTCAGRTDAGVHARCQVVHFDSPSDRSGRQWILGANSLLPVSVCVRWAQPVSDDFHARFSAVERSYRYTIINRWVRPALRAGQVSWCRYPLDAAAMDKAASILGGEHDFSAFRSSGCKARHAVREVNQIAVWRDRDEVKLDISANGFLYHMVRNITGTLIDIGKGDRPVDWMADLLKSGDRSRAGATAPPDGLCFMGVRYPAHYGLPGEAVAFPDDEAQA